MKFLQRRLTKSRSTTNLAKVVVCSSAGQLSLGVSSPLPAEVTSKVDQKPPPTVRLQ